MRSAVQWRWAVSGFLLLAGMIVAISCSRATRAVIELAPTTPGNRIEVALAVPENGELVLEWELEVRPGSAATPEQPDSSPLLEVWSHPTGGFGALVDSIQPDADADPGGARISLAESAGDTVLLTALFRNIAPGGVRWTRAELHGDHRSGWTSSSPESDWIVAPPPEAPNVVVYLVDALRADALGIAGTGPTPNWDRLAESGITFTQAMSTASWTRAGVASLFTGLSPSAHGVTDKESSLAEGAFTIAERFRLYGYDTLSAYTNGHVSHRFAFDQGFQIHSITAGKPGANRNKFDPDKEIEHARADKLHADTMRLLRERAAADPQAPLFLYMHTVDVHAPYDPPDWLLDGEKPSMNVNPAFIQQANRRGISASDLDTLTELYRGEVAYADREFGRFLDELGEVLDLDNTIILVTADHGEALNEHGVIAHGKTVFQEDVHIPMILWGPGILPTGVEIDTPVSLVDVIPTLLSLAGHPSDGPLAEGVQGLDVSAEWLGSSLPSDRFLLAENDLTQRPYSAVRMGNWKLIHDRARDSYSLFDLQADPGEVEDLYAAEPEQGRRLAYLLLEWNRDMQGFSLPGSSDAPAALPPDVLDNLRALGYIQ